MRLSLLGQEELKQQQAWVSGIGVSSGWGQRLNSAQKQSLGAESITLD